MPDESRLADRSVLVKPGDEIEVPPHGWAFGTGRLRMRVQDVGPAFWHEGTVKQEVRGTPVRRDGVVLPVRVVTVRVDAVRKIPNRRPGM